MQKLPKIIIFGFLVVMLTVTSVQQPSAAKINNRGPVKNIIFMIPDGYSAAYGVNYRWYKGKETLLDGMLVGMHRSYSANAKVTDSAAAATAMSTGVKTNNGMIGMSPQGNRLKTILEASAQAGKSTGLVATSTITHATPAAFASHVASRANEIDIAPQYLENQVDVIMGGGRKYFPDPLLNQARNTGYKIIFDRKELNTQNQTNKLIGLFATDALSPELDRETTEQPSLAEMTTTALNILQKNKKGFFLLIEGSQIDWGGHHHDAAWAMKDAEAFEAALAKVLQFAKQDRNTLVVVAADHDNGGMSVGAHGQYDAKIEILRNVTATGDFMVSKLNANRSNVRAVIKQYTNLDLTEPEVQRIMIAAKPDIAINEIVSERALVGWTTNQHTGVDIPLYAFGPNSEWFRGLHQNTDIPKIMAEAMNVPFQ